MRKGACCRQVCRLWLCCSNGMRSTHLCVILQRSVNPFLILHHMLRYTPQADTAASRPFWHLATLVGATTPAAEPLHQARRLLGRFMCPLRPIGGWREEWALAALEVMSHNPSAVADHSSTLAAVRGAATCRSLKVRRAAATFLAVRDPASTVF